MRTFSWGWDLGLEVTKIRTKLRIIIIPDLITIWPVAVGIFKAGLPIKWATALGAPEAAGSLCCNLLLKIPLELCLGICTTEVQWELDKSFKELSQLATTNHFSEEKAIEEKMFRPATQSLGQLLFSGMNGCPLIGRSVVQSQTPQGHWPHRLWHQWMCMNKFRSLTDVKMPLVCEWVNVV